MKGDFSRLTIQPGKHYSGVLLQQGRVQLDADWNEQQAIQQRRDEAEAADMIGQNGAPKTRPGFELEPSTNAGADLLIKAGHFYLDGIWLENDQDVAITDQPYLPGFQLPADADGIFLAYLEAWQRHITHLEDSHIRETALGGPDSATRLQTVWQVRLLKVTPQGGKLDCATPFPEWGDLLEAKVLTETTGGKLTARTNGDGTGSDPACILPPAAGYRRLENQLYRVEIHKGGTRAEARFKWSRDNGSIASQIESIDGSEVVVSDMGKDDYLGFASGQWIELSDDRLELNQQHGFLAQIHTSERATRILTLTEAAPTDLDLTLHATVRRWDQSGPDASKDGYPMGPDPIQLEGGIEIQFSEGSYKEGDFWLIPARTAVSEETGEIEWPRDESTGDSRPLPAYGTTHHFNKLAVLQRTSGSFSLVEDGDCRLLFPSLTTLTAGDIGFNNDACQLGDAATVQDALDRLCAARDLRHHNKNLHGWGIVCGLQVTCGPDDAQGPRGHITLRNGYAIDCDGNDMILDDDLQIPILQRILEYDQTHPNDPILKDGNGDASLILEMSESTQIGIGIEKYQNDTNIESLLSGTLLMDFYNDCIKNPLEELKKLFTPGPDEEKLPVGPTRKRLMSLFNLTVQVGDQVNARYIYLSPKEDQFLGDYKGDDQQPAGLYFALRQLIQSETYCALFDDARPYPKYPFSMSADNQISTIFGKNLHNHIRIHPNGGVAYTMGVGNKINLYDLKAEELIAEIEVPAGAGNQVRDLAFASNGLQIYVIATLNGDDTVFLIGDVIAGKINWHDPVTICDIELVTLLTAPGISEDVYAIGRNKGLYKFNPNNIPVDLKPVAEFNAVGHLIIHEGLKVAFATASAAPGAAGKSNPYNQVMRINLDSFAMTPISLLDPAMGNLTGTDDIVLFPRDNQLLLTVVVDLPSQNGNKGLWIVNVLPDPAIFVTTVSLGEKTSIRLAPSPAGDFLPILFEGSNRLRILNIADLTLVQGFLLPVQVSPQALATVAESSNLYVLNATSNTLTVIPKISFTPGASPISPGPGSPDFLKALIEYRRAALDAYADLAGGVTQYLKDCFFDHFLVNCPTCDPQDKIYLASVSIRSNQVLKVCNYSRRKYVKSFPTMEYWFSVIPIVPLFDRIFEQLACMVFPDLFKRYKTPPAEEGRSFVRTSSFYQAFDFLANTSFRKVFDEKFGQLKGGQKLAQDFMASRMQPSIRSRERVVHSDIVGRSVEDAQQRMDEANVAVTRVEAYNPNRGVENLVKFTSAPPVITPGSHVTLYEENGVVRYYGIESEAVVTVQALRTKLEGEKASQAEVESLKGNFAQLQKTLAEKDKDLDGLRTQVQKLEARPVSGDIEAATKRISELEGELNELRKFREEVNNFMSKPPKPRSPRKPQG